MLLSLVPIIVSAYICNFRISDQSNLCPVVPNFRDIAVFLLKSSHPRLFSYSMRNLGYSPWTKVSILGSEERRLWTKSVYIVITFEVTKPVWRLWLWYINASDRRADEHQTTLA